MIMIGQSVRISKEIFMEFDTDIVDTCARYESLYSASHSAGIRTAYLWNAEAAVLFQQITLW
jgi:hypothetical protein